MKIAVIDDYQDAFRKVKAFPKLEGHEVVVFTDTEKDPENLAARLKDADAVVLTQQRSRVPRAVIERLPKLKLISQTGRNANHIDVAACAERGVVVSAGGGGSPNPTAELTWGLILAHLRHIPEEVQRLKEGKWQHTVGIGLKDKTLGVYAYGRIGSVVANVGRAFGMKVICFGREGSTSRARDAGFEVTGDRKSFFESADILSIHLPLNKDTRGIVTAADGFLPCCSPKPALNARRAPVPHDGRLQCKCLLRGWRGITVDGVALSRPASTGIAPAASKS
jgi:D-3-phosphoglycerate dehydrogenase